MKFILTITLILLTQSPLFSQIGGVPVNGGPDAFGYTWQTSQSGVTFTWEELRSNATLIVDKGDDNVTAEYTAISTGFLFPYYGATYDKINISINGYITVGATNVNSTGGTGVSTPISVSTPNGYIAPYACDLNTSQTFTGTNFHPYASKNGSIWYKTFGVSPNRYFVVEWDHVNKHSVSTIMYTFQVAIFENGNIEFRYKDVSIGGVGNIFGVNATIGIESYTGLNGLTYSQNLGSLTNDFAIRFRPNAFPISFNANGGIGSMLALYAISNATETLPPCSFTNTGFTFAGWATSAGGPVIYNNSASITVATSTTLYAKWEPIVITPPATPYTSLEIKGGAWNLVGMSLPQFSNISGVLPFEKVGNAWTWIWNSASENYDTPTFFSPGKGYWIYAENNLNLSFTNLVEANPYGKNMILSLNEGWNMVSAAGLYAYSPSAVVNNLGDSIGDLSDFIDDTFWNWDSSESGYTAAQILLPWSGSFVYAKSACLIKFTNIDPSQPQQLQAPKVFRVYNAPKAMNVANHFSATSDNWTASFSLTTKKGRDLYAFAGVRPLASDSKDDKYDLRKAPASPGANVQILFDGSLAGDMKEEVKTVKGWPLTVIAEKGAGDAHFEYDFSEIISAGLTAAIVDSEGNIIATGKKGVITFEANDSVGVRKELTLKVATMSYKERNPSANYI